jgi:hypothetical protein
MFNGSQDDLLLHEVLSHGTNWSLIAMSHVPQRTTLSLKNRYATLRLRHENISKSNEPERPHTINPITLIQNERHIQRPSTTQVQKTNGVWNEDVVRQRDNEEAVSDKDDLSGENDSSEDEEDGDPSLPPLDYNDHSNNSSLSITGSLLPPTPGSWLGLVEQDGGFMALLSNDEASSMIPRLDENKATTLLERSFVPNKSAFCPITGSASSDNETEKINTCGLSETHGSLIPSWSIFQRLVRITALTNRQATIQLIT